MKKIGIKKFTSLLVTLVMVLSILTPFGTYNASAADSKTFDLIEITDFHGALIDSSTPALPVAAVLAKDIKDIKATNPTRTLILGGGDLYQGTPISNVLQGVPVQKVMDEIGLEVTALGNHEFDWGLNVITDKTMKDAKYSIICSNLYDKTTGKRVFAPYKIIEKDGVKIGLIGAITTETPSIVLPSNIANYNIADPTKEINGLVSEVKAAGAQVVLAVLHEGTFDTTPTGPIFDIANKLVGIDAVFGGHSHTAVNQKAANGIPVYIAKSSGKGYIDAKMTIGADGKPSFVCDATSFIATDNNTAVGYKAATPAQDPAVKTIVDDAVKAIGPTFDEVIGKDATDLTRTQMDAPYGESQLGNWMADVVKNNVGADVGIVNNGGIRIDVPAGDITVGRIFNLMPFDNTVTYVNMTGAQLKTLLNQVVVDNGKGLQISGVKFVYDSKLPSGSRITKLIKEKDYTPIKDTDMLKVAAPDFVGTGGDGFAAFTIPSVKATYVDTHTLVRDALIADVKAKGKITSIMNNRISTQTAVINVVATSDLHGSIMPIDYSSMKPSDSGLAKVSTVVNSLRAANPGKVMLIDNGDTIQGTPLVYYYNMIDQTTEYPMMKVMGAMGYDAWTLGNHEFNFGLDTLGRVMKDAATENIKVLSANTYNTADNTNFVKPYTIKSFIVNGKPVSVAVLGLTTKTVPSWEDAAHYKGLQFNDLVDEATKWTKALKTAGVDIVIASIHSGIAGASDTIPENQVDAVAKNVPGIDAIVAGHTHSAIPQQVYTNPDGKQVIITEPKNTDKIFSEIDIAINGKGQVGLVTSKNITLDGTIAADPKILSIAKPYEDTTEKYLNTVLGASTDEFSGKDQTIKPTALMDLINITQMKAAGTQLSIAAPLSATAYIPKGDVTIQSLMGVYVYENFLYGVKMNGKQIKNWMELSVKYYKQVSKAGDPIVKDPVLNTPDYNLDFLYGATYDVDLTQPVGSRIKNLKYNGKAIADTDEFTVAINNYRFNGGGGFMAAAGLKPGDTSVVTYDSAKKLGDDGQVRSLMMQYIKDNKTITPTVSDNWKLYTSPVEVK